MFIEDDTGDGDGIDLMSELAKGKPVRIKSTNQGGVGFREERRKGDKQIMPMDFPDMDSLVRAAEAWKFRQPTKGETEAQYRNALADFVAPKDLVESEEIRNGVGWDQWNEEQKLAALRRGGLK